MASIGQYKGIDIMDGTQDYVNQQIRNIDALATKPNIPPTTPPTSAKDISGNFPSFNMPNVPTTYTPIDSAIATTAGEKEYVSRVQKEQEAAFNRAQQQTEADRGILSQIMSSKPDRKKIVSEAESELDTSRAEMLNQINSVIKEVESLNDSYNKEKERGDLFINQLEENKAGVFGPGVLNSFLTRAEKDQAVKLNALAAGINAKTATIEALRGNYKLANDYIQQAVDAETAQYKDDVDALLLYRDFNNDAFERIDSVYRDAYEAEITIAQNRLNDEREKSMAKYKSGLDADTGVVGVMSSFSDVMQSVIDAGGTPEQAARAAAQESELMGVQVDQKQLARFVEEARTLTKSVSTTTETQTSQIEQDISSVSSNPAFARYSRSAQKDILRKELIKKGYTPDEITRSSAGTINQKIVTSVGSFFGKLFGE